MLNLKLSLLYVRAQNMVYYIATVKRGIRLHGWNTQTNLSLFPLRPSIIHNISHGFVGWLYCTGPSEVGVQEGQNPPRQFLLHKLHPQKVLNYQLFTLRRPLDFQTFLRSYCMYICSTLSSSIHQHRQQLSANTMYCTC